MKKTFEYFAPFLLLVGVAFSGCRSTSPLQLTPPTLPTRPVVSAETDQSSVKSSSPASTEQSEKEPAGKIALASHTENDTVNATSQNSYYQEPSDDPQAIAPGELPDTTPADNSAVPTESNGEGDVNVDDDLESEPSVEISSAKETNDSSESTGSVAALTVEAILNSTLNFYPAIQDALQLNEVARGKQLSAQGGFDTKFKLESENTPVGFYETYRQNLGIELPTFNGGSVFGGYRLGRGDFEPWYLERNTNAGGEFKVGARIALSRGRDIDQRRVDLWQANWEVQAVDPQVRQALIEARFLAEATYWSWVAAGQVKRLNEQILKRAEDRQSGIDTRVAKGDLRKISSTDNKRTVVSRRVKLIESEAKLQQIAAKLSLFYRNDSGTPLLAEEQRLPQTETQGLQVDRSLASSIQKAVAERPELELIDIEAQQVGLDISKAQNDMLPQLDFEFAFSQDIGDPTSASAAASSSLAVFANFDEKDEFKVDAALFLNQNLERRKARGKVRSLRGKRTQLEIKRAFLVDKITAEVEQAYANFVATIEQQKQAKQGWDLAKELSEKARTQLKAGDIDLFDLILREQQEIAAATLFIEATLKLNVSRARLNAAMGVGLGNSN